MFSLRLSHHADLNSSSSSAPVSAPDVAIRSVPTAAVAPAVDAIMHTGNSFYSDDEHAENQASSASVAQLDADIERIRNSIASGLNSNADPSVIGATELINEANAKFKATS